MRSTTDTVASPCTCTSPITGAPTGTAAITIRGSRTAGQLAYSQIAVPWLHVRPASQARVAIAPAPQQRWVRAPHAMQVAAAPPAPFTQVKPTLHSGALPLPPPGAGQQPWPLPPHGAHIRAAPPPPPTQARPKLQVAPPQQRCDVAPHASQVAAPPAAPTQAPPG